MSKLTTLGALVAAGHLELGDGYRTKRSEHGQPGLPILRVADVLDGSISPSFEDFVCDKYRRSMGAKVSQPGDVILTTKGTVGRVAIIPHGSPEFVYSPQLCYFRVSAGSPLNARYLYYWFRSDYFWSQAGSRKSQTDMADYINLADIRSLKIAIPSLPAQRAIVEVLGALDDKIAVNRRVGQTALELATATYICHSTSLSWREATLDEAARWYSGGTPRTSEAKYWNGDIPWISALSLKSPWIEWSDRKLTPLGAASGTRLVGPNVIIFVVRGSSLKEEFRVGITQRQVAFGQDCKALECVEGISPDLLFHAIRSQADKILDLVDETSIGAGRLATDLIGKLRVRVPVVGDNEVANVLRHLNQLAAVRQRETRMLVELRDTLLLRLMSGTIRVRDVETAVEEA